MGGQEENGVEGGAELSLSVQAQNKAARDRAALEDEQVELLKAPLWLNDMCIEIWLENMMDEVVPDDRSDVCFISPSSMAMLNFGLTSEYFVTDWKGLELPSKALTLMPINDNVEEKVGGSHWALLAYFRPLNTFRMYDSMGTNLRAQAEKAASELSKTFQADNARFEIESDSPRQTNAYDCGAYVCVLASELARCFILNQRLMRKDDLQAITPEVVRQRRAAMWEVAKRDRQARGGTALRVWKSRGCPC
mmetsp:Transcript_13055/g.30333  ORF Transcript_13055/g.30333 Transcript_13055/m.30333 type:complete len:250 (-) Transcript_13055:1355-2104(-)